MMDWHRYKARIDELRGEKGLLSAKDQAWEEELLRAVNEAKDMDDIKEILGAIITPKKFW